MSELSLSGRQPKAVQSALRVLESVARLGTGVTAKQIAADLSMPGATAYRLLNILVSEGYLVRVPDLSGFALGHKISIFVDAAVVPSVSTAVRDILAEVRMTVRFGVHLFYFTTSTIRIADADPEYPPPKEESFLNQHQHACAIGKLLLAEKSDITETVPTRKLAMLTESTITRRSELVVDLGRVRDQGYATQVGELAEHSACVAFPIRSSSGVLVGGLAMSADTSHAALLARQVDTLAETAARLAPLIA